MKEKKVFVYLIKHNDVVKYVGKTGYIAQRFSNHKNMRGTNYSAIPVDVDLSKIEFNVIDEFDNNLDAVKLEDELILKYDTINTGWNELRSGHIRIGDEKEYNRIKAKEWRDKHPEETIEYRKKHYETHKNKILEKSHVYHQTHKDEIREAHRKYREQHREQTNTTQREWYQKNIEKCREYKRIKAREYRLKKKLKEL